VPLHRVTRSRLLAGDDPGARPLALLGPAHAATERPASRRARHVPRIAGDAPSTPHDVTGALSTVCSRCRRRQHCDRKGYCRPPHPDGSGRRTQRPRHRAKPSEGGRRHERGLQLPGATPPRRGRAVPGQSSPGGAEHRCRKSANRQRL